MTNIQKFLVATLFVIATVFTSTSAFAQGGCVYFPVPDAYQSNPNGTNVYRVATGANASGAPVTPGSIYTDSTLGTLISQTGGVPVPQGLGTPFSVCAAAGAYTIQFSSTNGGSGYFNYNIFIPPDVTAMGTTTTRIVDATDGTKKIAFAASGATASTTLTLADVATTNRTLTFPDAADTLVGKATTDELTNKTITAGVIKTGLTASGSASNDFSASTGTFKTSTGAVTIGAGAISVTGLPTFTAGVLASGAVSNDFSGSTGTFKTSTGVNTFGGEGVFPASVTGAASANLPAGTAPTTPAAGDLWNDSTKKCVTFSNIASDPACMVGTLITLQPQTAITTVSTIQVMNSTTITVPAGALNVQGKHLRACGFFIWSNGVTAPLITISLKFGSVVLAAPASSANANSNTNSPADFCFNVTTASTGASGTLEAHGVLHDATVSATPGTLQGTFPDTVTAASSAVDLTASITLTVNMTVTSGPVTSATLRQMTVELLN